MTILIKGGHVINPATQMDEVADVLIKDQKIKKIGKELPEKEAERVINADGCYVMPGLLICMYISAIRDWNRKRIFIPGCRPLRMVDIRQC